MPVERAGPLRSAENTVHDLIAVSNDLRQHVERDLVAQGYLDLRPRFAPLLTRLRHGPVAQGRLAAALGVSAQAASQTVTLAEAAGYVTRLSNPDDGRSKLVVLTDQGRALIGAGALALAGRAAQYEDHLGHRTLARFTTATTRLQRALRLQPGDADATGGPRTPVAAVSALADHAVTELRGALHAGGHGTINASQNLVLVHVGADGSRPSDLARAQRVSRQAVSAILRELVELGYVTRHQDPADARSVVVVPTAQGRSILDVYTEGIDDLERRYQEILGTPRWNEFRATAHDLRHRLGIERWSLADAASPTAPPRQRGDAAIVDLATDLWRWLGETDAVRLTSLMAQMAAERSRGDRTEDGRLTTSARTR